METKKTRTEAIIEQAADLLGTTVRRLNDASAGTPSIKICTASGAKWANWVEWARYGKKSYPRNRRRCVITLRGDLAISKDGRELKGMLARSLAPADYEAVVRRLPRWWRWGRNDIGYFIYRSKQPRAQAHLLAEDLGDAEALKAAIVEARKNGEKARELNRKQRISAQKTREEAKNIARKTRTEAKNIARAQRICSRVGMLPRDVAAHDPADLRERGVLITVADARAAGLCWAGVEIFRGDYNLPEIMPAWILARDHAHNKYVQQLLDYVAWH